MLQDLPRDGGDTGGVMPYTTLREQTYWFRARPKYGGALHDAGLGPPEARCVNCGFAAAGLPVKDGAFDREWYRRAYRQLAARGHHHLPHPPAALGEATWARALATSRGMEA